MKDNSVWKKSLADYFLNNSGKRHQPEGVCIMPKISKSEFIKLHKKLKTDPAIGKKFGVSRQSIHQIRKKYGIKLELCR